MATFPNRTISGIRAPLTVDDSDSEYSVSSPTSRRNSIASSYYSNSELDTEGFDDESETRPYVISEYGFYEPSSVVEIVQENQFSSLSVRNPGEDFAQETGTVDGNSFLRPFARSPDEDFAQKTGNDDRCFKVISKVNDSDDSRSFLGDSGDESVASEENSPSPIVDITKIPVVQNLHIPIAKISRESDDDDDGSKGSEVVEDEGFSSIVQVPSYGVLSRINSVPKVRISEADDDVSVSQAEDEDAVEMEFVKDLLVSDDCVLGPKDDEEEDIDVEDIIKCVIAFDKVQDEGPETPIKDEVGHLLDIGEKIQEIDVNVDWGKCVNPDDCSSTCLDDKFHKVDASIDQEKCVDSVDLTNISLDVKFQEIDANDDREKCLDSVDCSNTSLNPSVVSSQSVFDVAESDQEAENSEESPVEFEVKCSDHFNDNKESVDEMAQDSIKMSYEEILLHNSHESDCQILTNLVEPQLVKFTSEDSVALSSDLHQQLCILVIGKTGVGKSATVNSIFGEHKTTVNAFQPSTSHVKEINGEINGVKVKVFDTPGLRVSPADQTYNMKILSWVKRITRKSPPDVVLYVERLDAQFTNSNDSQMLRLVTSCLGPWIWKKSVLAFTHSDSPPPEGPDGSPLSYEEFVDQQSWAFQQLIGQSSCVALVENENHLSDKREKWRLNLLSLCCSVKILSEVETDDHPVKCLKLFSSPQILTRLVFEAYNDGGCGFPTLQFTKDKKRFDVKLRLSVSNQLMVSALAFLPIAKAVSGRFL